MSQHLAASHSQASLLENSTTLARGASMPKLPGYSVSSDPTKRDFKRHSHFSLVNGYAMDNTGEKPRPPPGEFTSLSRPQSITPTYLTGHEDPTNKWQTSSMDFNKSVAQNFTDSICEPGYIKNDRRVLRFFGFFLETVSESRVENYRLRKLTIYLYLDDGTIYISEPRQENAGAPQGAFLRRQYVPKSDGSGDPLRPEDIAIGVDLFVYGRTIHIVDCDGFTRQYYDEIGSPQGPAQSYPEDQYAQSLKVHEPVKDPEFAKFIQVTIGAVKPRNASKFYEFDNQNLRFYATWHDSDTVHGGKRKFEVIFFLADSTVTISEIRGKGQFDTMIRRQKLPKNFKVTQPGLHDSNPELFHQLSDLYLGATIKVFGRDMLITSCDPSAEHYLKENGYNVGVAPRGETPPSNNQSKAKVIPPYTGYGTEEDSMGSVYHLVPKVPKKNLHKMLENQRTVLRFSAKLLNETVNPNRRFIINCYLGDDTVAIFELPLKNSGILNGKFLERGKYKNKHSGEKVQADKVRYFKPSDFYTGSRVQINTYVFEILEADAFTQRYIDGHPTVAPVGALQKRLRDFASICVNSGKPLKTIFKSFLNQNSKVAYHDFQHEIKHYLVEISEEEIEGLFHFFDDDSDGLLDFNEFLAVMTNVIESLTRIPYRPTEDSDEPKLSVAESVERNAQKAHTTDVRAISSETRADARANKVVTEFAKSMFEFRDKAQEIYRLLADGKHTLTKEEFAKALQKKRGLVGHHVTDLVGFFFSGDRETMTYDSFIKDLYNNNLVFQ